MFKRVKEYEEENKMVNMREGESERDRYEGV
jgi:hypothetical protein